MVLDSASAGSVYARREVEIDFISSALYAAAIGAERELYLDDRLLGAGMAPPFFITSLEWPLVSGPEFLAALGIEPADLFPRLLHVFQDSTFATPIRIGDRLALEATLESVNATRGGAVAAVRVTTINARSKAPVAESWFGGYFRNMAVRFPRTSRPPPAIAPFAPAANAKRDMISISRSASHIYSECARLQNPIHTNMSFATGLGYPDIALHGSLLWAKLGELMIDQHLVGRPEHLRRLALRFKRPMFPNRDMVAKTFLSDSRTGSATLQVCDKDSGDILSEGVAEFDL